MQNSEKSFSWFVLMMILSAGIGGILYGYDVGVFSGAFPFIRDQLHLTNKEVGWIGGGMFFGSLIGTLLTGYLTDQFGRRKMIFSASILFLIGIGLITHASTFQWILIARILIGVGIGIIQVSVPAYLAEIAPTAFRGLSVTVFQLFLTLGIVVAYMVDLIFTSAGDWQSMFMVVGLPATLLLMTMLLLPESPRWLLSKNHEKEALTVLKKTRSPKEAEKEFDEITVSLQAEQGNWHELFSKKLIFLLCIALSIAIFNQFTGINCFLQYAPDVFKEAGIHSNTGAMLATVGLGAINFLGTVFAMLVVDVIGRRKLIITGTAGIVLFYLFLAITSYLQLPSELAGHLAVFGLLGFVVCFAIGPGVVVWLAMSELFPTKVRGKGLSLCLFANSLAAWLVTTFFLQIKDSLGLGGSYLIFALLTFLYCIVCIKFLPETKQKSLEAVQESLKIKGS